VLWLGCACGVLLPALVAGVRSVPCTWPLASNATHFHDSRTAPRGTDDGLPNEFKPPSGGRFANADADEESAERSVTFSPSPLALLRLAFPALSVDASIADHRDRRTHASHRFPLIFRLAPRPPPVLRQL